jgi:hypothetical protein
MVYCSRFRLTASLIYSDECPVVCNWIFWLWHCAPRRHLSLFTLHPVCADQDSFGRAKDTLGLGFDGDDGKSGFGFFRRKSTLLGKITFLSILLVLFAKPLLHICYSPYGHKLFSGTNSPHMGNFCVPEW